eukprot:TRINITY_DN29984_c0_g1_i1.p1 TRINITY_DN29984_c0_g1~~TRINITY_DN29984_c0_g1_i1.p1  ORF type:complete len:1513 (+),score=474.37 TRINITY_DN29984_c0_g1_i1:39-4541(+)
MAVDMAVQPLCARRWCPQPPADHSAYVDVALAEAMMTRDDPPPPAAYGEDCAPAPAPTPAVDEEAGPRRVSGSVTCRPDRPASRQQQKKRRPPGRGPAPALPRHPPLPADDALLFTNSFQGWTTADDAAAAAAAQAEAQLEARERALMKDLTRRMATPVGEEGEDGEDGESFTTSQSHSTLLESEEPWAAAPPAAPRPPAPPARVETPASEDAPGMMYRPVTSVTHCPRGGAPPVEDRAAARVGLGGMRLMDGRATPTPVPTPVPGGRTTPTPPCGGREDPTPAEPQPGPPGGGEFGVALGRPCATAAQLMAMQAASKASGWSTLSAPGRRDPLDGNRAYAYVTWFQQEAAAGAPPAPPPHFRPKFRGYVPKQAAPPPAAPPPAAPLDPASADSGPPQGVRMRARGVNPRGGRRVGSPAKSPVTPPATAPQRALPEPCVVPQDALPTAADASSAAADDWPTEAASSSAGTEPPAADAAPARRVGSLLREGLLRPSGGDLLAGIPTVASIALRRGSPSRSPAFIGVDVDSADGDDMESARDLAAARGGRRTASRASSTRTMTDLMGSMHEQSLVDELEEAAGALGISAVGTFQTTRPGSSGRNAALLKCLAGALPDAGERPPPRPVSNTPVLLRARGKRVSPEPPRPPPESSGGAVEGLSLLRHGTAVDDAEAKRQLLEIVFRGGVQLFETKLHMCAARAKTHGEFTHGRTWRGVSEYVARSSPAAVKKTFNRHHHEEHLRRLRPALGLSAAACRGLHAWVVKARAALELRRAVRRRALRKLTAQCYQVWWVYTKAEAFRGRKLARRYYGLWHAAYSREVRITDEARQQVRAMNAQHQAVYSVESLKSIGLGMERLKRRIQTDGQVRQRYFAAWKAFTADEKHATEQFISDYWANNKWGYRMRWVCRHVLAAMAPPPERRERVKANAKAAAAFNRERLLRRPFAALYSGVRDRKAGKMYTEGLMLSAFSRWVYEARARDQARERGAALEQRMAMITSLRTWRAWRKRYLDRVAKRTFSLQHALRRRAVLHLPMAALRGDRTRWLFVKAWDAWRRLDGARRNLRALVAIAKRRAAAFELRRAFEGWRAAASRGPVPRAASSPRVVPGAAPADLGSITAHEISRRAARGGGCRDLHALATAVLQHVVDGWRAPPGPWDAVRAAVHAQRAAAAGVAASEHRFARCSEWVHAALSQGGYDKDEAELRAFLADAEGRGGAEPLFLTTRRAVDELAAGRPWLVEAMAQPTARAPATHYVAQLLAQERKGAEAVRQRRLYVNKKLLQAARRAFEEATPGKLHAWVLDELRAAAKARVFRDGTAARLQRRIALVGSAAAPLPVLPSPSAAPADADGGKGRKKDPYSAWCNLKAKQAAEAAEDKEQAPGSGARPPGAADLWYPRASLLACVAHAPEGFACNADGGLRFVHTLFADPPPRVGTFAPPSTSFLPAPASLSASPSFMHSPAPRGTSPAPRPLSPMPHLPAPTESTGPGPSPLMRPQSVRFLRS